MGFIKDTNKFILISIGVLLAMLPIIASVFGGVVLADYFSNLEIRQQFLMFGGMIAFIALLTFVDIRKKLHIKR